VRKIAVFASGRGSNFINIYENIQRGRLDARVVCLISNKPETGAIEYAEQENINRYIVVPKDFLSSDEFGHELLRILKKHEAEWIVLAGYLKKIPDNVVHHYSNKIVNIHPALLPAFGGKGMYGMHVHEAVFRSGAKISGVTVHLVNEVYDAGPIVMQRAVDIEACKNPEEIAKTVLATEHQLFSEALQRLYTTEFKIEFNRVIFE
jgi:formyltetrahydrofolate-dependent phosphoribosylglycinamide formyltransferase